MIADMVTTEWAPADTPFDATPTWVDISQHVRTTRTAAGSRNLNDLYAPGSCTLEVNNNLGAGAWLDPDVWYRWRQLRIYTADSTLFHGWIKSVTYNVGFRDGISQARIEAVDAVGLLIDGSTDADFATYAAGSPIGAVSAKTIGGRAGYVTDGGVADVATWLLGSGTPALVAPDSCSRMPVFVEAKQSGNALQLLQDFLDAERGFLVGYSDGVGLVGRYYPFALAADASVATLADDGTGYKWLLGSLELAAPDESYIDDATIGGPGLDNQRTADVPTGYPPSTYVRTSNSPIADVNWAKANADMIVKLGKQTDTYPRALTCNVTGPTATSYDASHPAIVAGGNSNPPGSVALDVKYAGTTYRVIPTYVEHNIDERGWRCTFGFRSLDRIIAAYGSSQVFTLASSALGGADILGP